MFPVNEWYEVVLVVLCPSFTTAQLLFIGNGKIDISIKSIDLRAVPTNTSLQPEPDMTLYCYVPGSPCLSKTGPVYNPWSLCVTTQVGGSPVGVRFRPRVNGPKDPLARVLSLSGAKVVCWRPHLAGTRQYVY